MPVVKYRTDKKKAGGNTWWSEKEKYNAVAAYLVFGNMAEVSRQTGIPHITIRQWKAQPWWSEAEQEIKRGSKLEISGKLRKGIELAQMAVEDRLLNGDFVFNPKTGQLVRKQVSADTAIKVLGTLLDKQVLLEEKAEANVHVTAEGVTERLQKIADELLKFSKAKDVTPAKPMLDVIDVTPIETNEQREPQ